MGIIYGIIRKVKDINRIKVQANFLVKKFYN